MGSYTKQHYVPKFYLKNFTVRDSKNIYCFDKVSEKSFLTNIQDIAHENMFYGLAEIKDAVEHGLANLEQRFFVPAYNELLRLKNYKRLSHTSKGWFCLFLAFQLMRTKDTRLRIKELREKYVMEKAKEEMARENGTQIPDWLRINFTDPEYVKALHLDTIVRNGVEPFVESANYSKSTYYSLMHHHIIPNQITVI
jgi:hypothetical protein